MNWKEEDNKLKKEFEFENFKKALDFTNKVGEIAEAQKHHPDIILHDYKNVRIEVTTHDEGMKVTKKDHDFAEAVNQIT
ncbi:4a-hydroxytetrahydrobiopterin dehydratase [Brumimicrobium glaciale]|uniref:4a-hydroxytetrahydrobiopterin dehydratase n=1 Tax=Brumimicrobium glaciale TaxID=200475 RepID=A0A4Q4KNE4_9FLAO|nr:4a-hydroxytetrahydrobiopterin dehydratase [Brumimicrobium glaciale]RYM34963.1 4a-hydroxytetrahydrobiopterin dehydratase [Brumimicrobium glaciale]